MGEESSKVHTLLKMWLKGQFICRVLHHHHHKKNNKVDSKYKIRQMDQIFRNHYDYQRQFKYNSTKLLIKQDLEKHFSKKINETRKT